MEKSESFNDKISKIRKHIPESGFQDFGKLMPQNLEFEEAVLGSLLIENTAIDNIPATFMPEMFYKEEHKIICQAIFDLYKKGNPVDTLTVSKELRDTEKLDLVGGAYYLGTLTNKIGSSANIYYYCLKLIECYLSRRLIAIGSEMQSLAFEDTTDIFDLMDKCDLELQKTYEICNNIQIDDNIKSQIQRTIERIDNAKSGKDGITCRWNSLRQIMGNWNRGDLVIIAGRPGMGKTIAGIEQVLYSILSGLNVIFFSIEMGAELLLIRASSVMTNIKHTWIKNGTMSDDDYIIITNALSNLMEKNIKIIDSGTIGIQQMKKYCGQQHRKNKLDLIVIDYLQLIKTDKEKGKTRDSELGEVTRALKSMAKDFNCPVICLCQLSREVEKQKREPRLSDLRESGNIEQDADVVILLYRPSYYNESNDSGFNDGYTKMIIAKNRHGSTDFAIAEFVKDTVSLRDY